MIDMDEAAARRSMAPPPLLNDHAPDFVTRTTMGERRLSNYRGRWLIFFSHPADFTPVCTSEFLAVAKAYPALQAAGCDLLALLVDSLFSHLAWARNIQSQFGVEIPFPIAEDPGLQIARTYGMAHPVATSSATVRPTFVIDPTRVIRAVTWCPMSAGRNVNELLLLTYALQAGDRHDALTPEKWQPGEPMLDNVAGTSAEAETAANQEGAADWYYRAKIYPKVKPKTAMIVTPRPPRLKDPTSAPTRAAAPCAKALRRANELADTCKVLGNANRLKIVVFLDEHDRSVSEIEAALGIHQPTLSQPLCALRNAGLITGRKVVKSVIYALTEGAGRRAGATNHLPSKRSRCARATTHAIAYRLETSRRICLNSVESRHPRSGMAAGL